MSKKDYIPETEGIMQLNELYYNCTKCQSPVEILSLNEKECKITFKCINNKHKINISIKDYINEMRVLNNKNINNDICEENQHNRQYEYYCTNCNKHLCKACLKSRKHIDHFKYNLFEIQPNKNELNVIENIIKYYDNKIEFLEKEKLKINTKFKETKNKLNAIKGLKLTENVINLLKEMKLKNDEYLIDMNNLRTKYEDDMKLIKNKYKQNIKEIKNNIR